jgi:hypothetical protein
MAKKKYQENPSREANIVIGGGLGVLLGGVLLGFPGALVGGGIGAVLGSEQGDTRRRALENPNRRPGSIPTLVLVETSVGEVNEGALSRMARRNRGEAISSSPSSIKFSFPSRFQARSFVKKLMARGELGISAYEVSR